MEYISISWSYIPERVIPIADRGLLITRNLLNQGFLLGKSKSSLRIFTVATIIYDTNDHGYVSLVVWTFWFFPHSWLITGFVNRLTRRVPLVEQELLTFLSSPPSFSGIRVTRSVVFMCMFCRCFFVLMSFFFWPLCCLSFSIYGFWLPIWYLQTLFTHICFLANCLLEFVFVQCGFDKGEVHRAFP